MLILMILKKKFEFSILIFFPRRLNFATTKVPEKFPRFSPRMPQFCRWRREFPRTGQRKWRKRWASVSCRPGRSESASCTRRTRERARKRHLMKRWRKRRSVWGAGRDWLGAGMDGGSHRHRRRCRSSLSLSFGGDGGRGGVSFTSFGLNVPDFMASMRNV